MFSKQIFPKVKTHLIRAHLVPNHTSPLLFFLHDIYKDLKVVFVEMSILNNIYNTKISKFFRDVNTQKYLQGS